MKSWQVLLLILIFEIRSLYGQNIISPLNGQPSFSQNCFYLEAAGNGFFGSVNYERQIANQSGLGVRIGVGFYSETIFHVTIPIGINYLFKLRNEKSFIDAGLGGTWARSEETAIGNNDRVNGEFFPNIIPSIGFRRHTSKNLMWRANLMVVLNKYSIGPWLGFSIGKRL